MSDSDEETPDLREPDDSDDEAPYDPINEHDLKILEGLHDQETTSPLAGSLLGSYCLDCDDGEFVELFEKLHVDSGGLLDALQGRVGTVEDDTSVWCIVVVVVAVVGNRTYSPPDLLLPITFQDGLNLSPAPVVVTHVARYGAVSHREREGGRPWRRRTVSIRTAVKGHHSASRPVAGSP
jgi:hypothetical protein